VLNESIPGCTSRGQLAVDAEQQRGVKLVQTTVSCATKHATGERRTFHFHTQLIEKIENFDTTGEVLCVHGSQLLEVN